MGTKYHIEDEDGMTELQEVAEEKDLGVYVTNDLKSETQHKRFAEWLEWSEEISKDWIKMTSA